MLISQADTACTSLQRWEEASLSGNALKHQDAHIPSVRLRLLHQKKKKNAADTQHNIILNMSQQNSSPTPVLALVADFFTEIFYFIPATHKCPLTMNNEVNIYTLPNISRLNYCLPCLPVECTDSPLRAMGYLSRAWEVHEIRW